MASWVFVWGTTISDAKHETRFSTGTHMFYHPSEQSKPIRFNTTQSCKASGACPDMSAEIMMAEAKANLWEECLIDLSLNKGENSAKTGRTFGFCFVLGCPSHILSQKSVLLFCGKIHPISVNI